MGRATIVGCGPDGSYSVTLDTGEATRTARVAALTATLAALVGELTKAQAALTAQQAAEASKKAPVDAAIAAYVAAARAQPVVPAALKAALADYVSTSQALLSEKLKTAPLRLALEALQATQAQAQKDRAYWAALVLTQTRQVWCADLTEDATGTVATLEIPGEDTLVLIEPAAPAPTAAHGLLTAREVQTGPQAYWNAAVLPGWQKWKPTYRRGVVTAVDPEADTADVSLDADLSSAQSLNINQTPTLAKVPVVYMDCHAKAFEVGDRCVVKFAGQSWDSPKVVGFVDNPKACDGWRVLSGVVRNATTQETAGVWRLRDYRPTANAWQKALKSDPAKVSWHDEELLTHNGSGNMAVGSAYSGLMAMLVQLLSGYGKMLYPGPNGAYSAEIPYQSGFYCTHGIIKATDGKPWLVEVSEARGVLAMRLPMVAGRKAGKLTLAAKALGDLFGGDVPSGGTFAADTSAALAAGTVLQLLTPAAMAAVYGTYDPHHSAMGWSFNLSGTEAHNTCQRVTGFTLLSAHYKIMFAFAAGVPSASLTQVSEQAVVHAASGVNVVEFNGNGLGNTFEPVTGVPDATLIVAHRGDTLVRLQLEWTGGDSNTWRLYFAGLAVDDMATASSSLYWVPHEWGAEDRFTGISGPTVFWSANARNGFMVRGSFAFDISMVYPNPSSYAITTHVLHPGGDIAAAGVWGRGVNIGAGGVPSLHYSVVGDDPHVVYPHTLMMRANGGYALSGTLLAGETVPNTEDVYLFTGLL